MSSLSRLIEVYEVYFLTDVGGYASPVRPPSVCPDDHLARAKNPSAPRRSPSESWTCVSSWNASARFFDVSCRLSSARSLSEASSAEMSDSSASCRHQAMKL